MAELKKIGVVLKRARYFILTADYPVGLRLDKEATLRALIDPGAYSFGYEQLSLFGPAASSLPEMAGLPGQPGQRGLPGQKFTEILGQDLPERAFRPGGGEGAGAAAGGIAALPGSGDVASAAEGVEEAILLLAQGL